MDTQPDLELGPYGRRRQVPDHETERLVNNDAAESDRNSVVKSTATATATHIPRQRRAPTAPCLRHKDAFGRETYHQLEDKQTVAFEAYLDPSDGRLQNLQVQSEEYLGLDKSLCWERVGTVSASKPPLLRLIDNIYDSEGAAMCLYLPTVFAMTFYLLGLSKIELELENGGFYDPVLYRNWRYPGIARNPKEDLQASPVQQRPTTSKTDGYDMRLSSVHIQRAPLSNTQRGDDHYGQRHLIERRPMPRYLCFVDSIDISKAGLNDTVATEVGRDTFEDYVFVSYTRAHFNSRTSAEDRITLLKIGMQAARQAGVRAFWLDCYPPNNPDRNHVYRICDVVRAAHSLVIAVRPEPARGSQQARKEAERQALRTWGMRLWTFPEVLLYAPRRKIAVYSPDLVASYYTKYHLGYLAWKEREEDRQQPGRSGPQDGQLLDSFNDVAADMVNDTVDDWEEASHLLDHYEGSIHLTQLELIGIAHQCLRGRRTSPNVAGDYAYVLMGLLRRRSEVHLTDSDFMAFARLSLSNNSDAILERLVCMQTPRKDMPWHNMVDVYGANLWDIEPTCQVAAVVDDPADQAAFVPRSVTQLTQKQKETYDRYRTIVDRDCGDVPEQAELKDFIRREFRTLPREEHRDLLLDEAALLWVQKDLRDSQTVILDNVHGASIRWSRLEAVPFIKRSTRTRRLTKILLPKVPFVFVIGVLLLAVLGWSMQESRHQGQLYNDLVSSQSAVFASQSSDFASATAAYASASPAYTTTVTAVSTQHSVYSSYNYASTTYVPITLNLGSATTVFVTTVTPIAQVASPLPDLGGPTFNQVSHANEGLLGLSIAVVTVAVAVSMGVLLAGPALLKNLYYGKFWSTQARFYGIEGCCTLKTAERSLFGLEDNRLKWSTNSSPQSKPYPVEANTDYEGMEPEVQPLEVRVREGLGRHVFTLIDTYVMEATVFYADRPPSVVMICGSEGGMQRALLCSYDWRTQTFCRETVLRMKTVVLDRMSRVDRFRFALRRDLPSTA